MTKPTDPDPINVSVPAIRIETCSLRFPDGQRWIFNVTRARSLARLSGVRELHALSPSEVSAMLADTLDGRAIRRELIDEADPRIPGIGAVIPYGGQRRLNLIDGTERAIRAMLLDQSFPVYVLSDAERDLCLWSKTGLDGIRESLDRGEWPGVTP